MPGNDLGEVLDALSLRLLYRGLHLSSSLSISIRSRDDCLTNVEVQFTMFMILAVRERELSSLLLPEVSICISSD